jgi:hypothetical protein
LIKKTIGEVDRDLPSYKKISDFIVREDPFQKNVQQKIRKFMYPECGKSQPAALVPDHSPAGNRE